eukprot:gene3483-6929_t
MLCQSIQTGQTVKSSTVDFDDDSFRNLIRDAKKNNSPKKLVKIVQQLSIDGKLNQNMTVTAVKTLQRMNRTDLCFELVPLWQDAVKKDESLDIPAAAALLKTVCRLHRIDIADTVMETSGLPPGDFKESLKISPEKIPIANSLLPELAFGYASSSKYQKALSTLQTMVYNKIPIDIEDSKNIFKFFVRETDGRSIRLALRYLIRTGGLTDNDSIQLLANAYMKSIEFRYGVVSMKTMPPETDMEAAFIGRSNVGKSSLINMVSNRKGLAFTSKTPGKTSEFNFFEALGRNVHVNMKTGATTTSTTAGTADDLNRFFLVDMPGVGYAEVTKAQRVGWIDVLRSYVSERKSLRVLFHLVDSRHGLLDADKECLGLLDQLPEYVNYVIVLTKADKRGGGARRHILQSIKTELKTLTTRQIPVILTSSDSRVGGAVLWSVLLDALAGDVPDTFESLLPVYESDLVINEENADID